MYILFIDGDRGTSENRPDPFFASLHVIVFVSFVSCSLSLSLSPHISVDWWSVHFPACRTYVDLTPQQDTNSFRAHDECNNHCPPTYLPPSLLLLLQHHHHRPTDPTLPNANERHTTMVINPTYLAQRTRSCTHSPRPSTYPTLPHSSGGMMMMMYARAKTNEGCFLATNSRDME